MLPITAQQSRDARRELGLSQADVTKSLDFNRQYLSEWETGFSTRLTNAQLKKLCIFYKTKIQEANDNGEDISLTFGDEPEDLEPAAPPLPISHVTLAVRHLSIDHTLGEAQLKEIIDKIAQNDAAATELISEKAERDDWDGGWSKDTDQVLRELFGRFAENYILLRHLQGRQIVVIEQPVAYDDIKTVGDLFSHLFQGDNAELLAVLAPPKKEESAKEETA